MAIDKVKLQVFADHSLAAAESMANTLYRTAYSTFVKETEDFTTGLATPEGQTYAAPRSLGSNWFVGLDYGNVVRMIDRYEEGDICITNDPYSGAVCTHTPDIHLWKPIFHAGEVVSFAVGHIHNTDMGGAVPASLSRTLTEIQQEGIRIPPMKLFKRGELNTELLEILLGNVRARDQNWGDLKAQVAAMNTGSKKVHEMIARFGIDDFRDGMEALLAYSEGQARSIIATIPNGEYYFQDYVDEDAAGGVPCRLACNMIVGDDAVTLDWRMSDPQVTSSMNVITGGFERHTLLMVGIYYAFYSLKPDMMVNTGITRPFRCLLADGSILDPKFPAAGGMRSLTVTRLQDVVFGCLSLALPTRMPAAPAGSISIMNVMTTDPRTGRRMMAAIDPLVGGGGAFPWGDGPNGSGGNAGTLKNTPVEINEVEVPIQILRYHLAQNSGGAGRWRGGLGTTLEFKVFSPNTVITARNRDRTRFQAWGVLGGHAGGMSRYVINAGTNHAVELGNTDIVTVNPGDVIHITSSGAGGFGDPLDRPPSAVLADVRQGFITSKVARDDYGVVVSDGAVDEDATNTLRRSLPRRPQDRHFDYGAEREAFETVWPPKSYDRLIELLQDVPVEWRFYLKRRMFTELAAVPAIETSRVTSAFSTLLEQFPQLRSH
jgi:N-methylhydantoinase B